MASSARAAEDQIFEELRSSTGFLLALLGQEATGRLRAALITEHLKPRQFEILSLLADHGSTGQRELGDMMAIDHSTLVTMLNPLEAERLIKRERNFSDRRRHVVTITPSGRRRLDRAVHAQQQAQNALLAGLSGQQRTELRDLLITLRDATEASHLTLPSNGAEPERDSCA
jgi:MarR family transcriptional regulator, lower aerobic nicotinate degradation pathway regulator